MDEIELVSPQKIVSPCVRKCCLDEQDICLGCFRSLTEIIAWHDADHAGRQEILRAAVQRKKEYKR